MADVGAIDPSDRDLGPDAHPRWSVFWAAFWQPPRPHGEVDRERSVSFLELFYDLVFVVVISRATHALALDVTWEGAGEFAVLFGLIWVAWLNGTLHHELHGREDGRSRTMVFAQMTVLAVLAVYTGEAGGATATGFAVTYSVLLVVIGYLWWSVRRVDAPEDRDLSTGYVVGIALNVVVMLASAGLPDGWREAVWALVVVAWVVGPTLRMAHTGGLGASLDLGLTDSLVERFGLFIIIVLGEVVVGVVDGLSEVDRTPETLGCGVLALMAGFGFWWTYFDALGPRLPRSTGLAPGVWIYANLPMSLAIAAGGAGMVSLVEHAADAATPAPTAWLVSGSVALFLLAVVVGRATLADDGRPHPPARALSVALVVGALAALAVGAWAPAPWVLAGALALILFTGWGWAVRATLGAAAR